MDLSLDWGQCTLNVLVTSTGRNFYTENKLAAANILEKKLWAKQWVPKPWNINYCDYLGELVRKCFSGSSSGHTELDSPEVLPPGVWCITYLGNHSCEVSNDDTTFTKGIGILGFSFHHYKVRLPDSGRHKLNLKPGTWKHTLKQETEWLLENSR